MRKLTALFIVLLFVTGMAFAQFPDGLKIGAWGRADFVPFQGVFEDDEDAVFQSGVGSGWKPAYWDINVSFTAADGRIGGQANISRADYNPEEGNLNIWAKPFGSDILYIQVGKYEFDDYRGGTGTDGNFQGFIGGPGKNADAIFRRLSTNDSKGGALFVTKPISGLSIFAEINPGWNTFKTMPAATEAKDAYKKIQAGLAYDISGIGLARAQWVGNSMDYDGTDWHPARIEAAFQLKAVEGLNLDLGIKLPIPVKEELVGGDTVYQDNFQLAVAGDFKAGDFGITYGLYGGFGGSTSVDSPGARRSKLSPTFDIILIPSFYVAAIDATVGADVGFKVKGASTTAGTKNPDQSTIFGFGGWISRDLGKGLIKTGLAYQLPAYTDKGIQDSTSYLSWPIILEISF
jgi:hypothetical protein